MSSLYLWSNYHLCFILKAMQEDRSHHPCGGRGVEQVKWVCDTLYYCLGDGSPVFRSRGDTDLLPDSGPSLWGPPHIFAFIYASALRSAGGRMCRTWCLSEHSLAPNMELSEHLSWSHQACVDVGQFGGFYLIVRKQLFKKLYNHVEDGLVSKTGG